MAAIKAPSSTQELASRLIASAERLAEAGAAAEAKELLIRAIQLDPLNQNVVRLLSRTLQPRASLRLFHWVGSALFAPSLWNSALLALVSFILLNVGGTWIGHYYWQEQRNFEHAKTILDRKITLTTTASRVLTRYLQTLQEIRQTQHGVNNQQSSSDQLKALQSRRAAIEQELAGVLTEINGYFGSNVAGLSIRWDNRRRIDPLDIEGLKSTADLMLSAMLAEIRTPPPPSSFWQIMSQMWRR